MNTHDTIEHLKREIRLTEANMEQLRRLANEKEKELRKLQQELRDWQEFKARGL